MATTKLVFVLVIVLASLSAIAAEPVPFLDQPLIPVSAAPGSAGFILTVNGAGFQSDATVYWNGSARITSFLSASRLTATINSADVAVAGTAVVTVKNGSGVASNSIPFPIAGSRSALSFTTSSYPVDTNPFFVATGDFNEDGKLDLAVINQNSTNLSILLGNGDGTFATRVDYPAQNQSIAIVTGDFNHDGHLDLAVADDSESISIFLGNGDGTFQPRKDTTTTLQPGTIAAGDLNGDGNLDLVFGYFDNSSTANIGVLLGNGDGTFQPIRNYPTSGSIVNGVALADLRNNGLLDVVATNYYEGTVAVLAANGDGTFQPAVTYTTGTNPYGAQLGDFNQDGFVDIATADVGGRSVSILLNRGDGTFLPSSSYGTGTAAIALVSGDLNGDGLLDLATSSEGSFAYAVSILEGNGDGTFEHYKPFLGGPDSLSIAIGDFNNDGMLDLVVPDYSANTVSVLLQDNGSVVVVAPSKITFATQVVGTISPGVNITVTNKGTVALTISGVATSANFSSTNNCGLSLAAGASCTVTAYFTPSSKGNVSGLLTITDNGGGSPQVVSLSGVATLVSVAPGSLSFGTQKVGTSSNPQIVTVTNTGSTTLRFNGITLNGKNQRDFTEVNACGQRLFPGTSCEISVMFSPTATGARSATIDINDNGGGSPQTVALSGTGN